MNKTDRAFVRERHMKMPAIQKKRDRMKERVIERVREDQAEKRILVTDHLPTTEEELAQWQSRAIVGGASVSFEDIKTRLLYRPAVMEIAPGLYETPFRVARTYLAEAYGHGPIGKMEQLKMCANYRPSPLFVDPARFEAGVFIDIKACYWNIMRVIGWNVDYWPGEWLDLHGRPPYDFPWPQHKIARNCLVSAGKFTHLTVYHPDYRNEKIRTEKRPNPLLNNMLQRAISDITHAIAWVCIHKAGFLYWNTDGGIAPNLGAARKAIGLIAEWGLEARIIASGKGEVIANGNYKVGRYESWPHRHKINLDPLPLSKVTKPIFYDLLKEQVAAAAADAMKYE